MRSMSIWLSFDYRLVETAASIGSRIDARLPAIDQLRYEAGTGWPACHSKMSVAEGQIEAAPARDFPQHRQAVRGRRSMTHPIPGFVRLERRKNALGMGDQQHRAPLVRRRSQAAEFDSSACA